jgi:hypothetical protein
MSENRSIGIGPPSTSRRADISTPSSAGGSIFGRFGLSLDIDNVADARAAIAFRSAIPFTVGDGNQTTPLRPRTIRIGFDTEF